MNSRLLAPHPKQPKPGAPCTGAWQDPPAQAGVVALITAVLMVGLIGVAALAVDVAHLLVLRTEVQNAVDAAALRGAALLYSNGSATPDFSASGPAVTGAIQAVNLNLAVTSQDQLQVQANYWQQLNASAPSNEAAIQVTLSKQATLYFARIFGQTSRSVSATSIALVQSPSTIGAGGTKLPMAIGSCMFSLFWDAENNQPKIDPSTNQPYVIQIGSSYGGSQDDMESEGSSSCSVSAQWTPLSSSEVESDAALAGIITAGNSNAFKTTDQIWLANGDKNNLYTDINNCSAAGDHSCEYSVVPVVSAVTPGSEEPITALSCLHVLSATGGSGKYISVQMSGGCTPNNASGSATSYGVTEAPKLAD